MKKQYIYVAAGGILVLVFLLSIFLFLQKKPATQPATQALTPSAPPSPTADTPLLNRQKSDPVDIVKKFYYWYTSYPGDPIASGAYKTYKDLTSGYKNTITRFYKWKKDPVFCTMNQRSKVTFAKATYNRAGEAIVNIYEDTIGGKKLYSVELQSVGNQWFISDSTCIP